MTTDLARPIDAAALLATLPSHITAIPARAAAREPDHLALIENERQLTYRQLVKASTAAAALLERLGVRAGDRVMIVAENSIAQIVLLFATAHLDAWALIANARLTAVELDHIHAHARPRIIVYMPETSAEARLHAQRRGAQAAPALPIDIGPWSYWCDPVSMPEVSPTAAEQQCAALIYTTGTTGAPKGVMLSHRNLLYIAAISSQLRRVESADRVYAALPISHVYGLASVCLGSLYAAATLRLTPRFTPAATLNALATEGITLLQGVPSLHAKLLDYLHAHGRAWHAPHLRFAYSGGAPLDSALKERVEHTYGIPLHNGYGMTESSPTIAQTRLDAPRADTAVGTPIPGISARLMTLDGKLAGPGDIGELWVCGPNVMLGYYRAPDATRAAITADGWLKTGDLAQWTADGALAIVGRCKELIIHAGFNVYPAEIEQVLNAHPQIAQAAVLGRKTGTDEEVIAFVELTTGPLLPPAVLRDWCAARLAPYKCPAAIHVLPALPVAATGKVLKQQLRDWLSHSGRGLCDNTI